MDSFSTTSKSQYSFPTIKNITDSVTLNNKVSMPVLGLGTWKSSPEEAYAASIAAISAGYIHLDTAQLYGNQTFFSKFQNNLPQGVNRKDIFLVSKVWITDFGPKKTLDAVDRILKECGVDVIDQVLLHFPAPEYKEEYPSSYADSNKKNRIESWRALETRYKEGKIRSIGVSNYMPRHIQDLIDNCEIVPSCNQIEIHPFLTRVKTREYCKKHGIAVVGYSPLAHGKIFQDETLKAIAEKYSKTIAQVAIRWALQNEIICIPKSTRPQRVVENADVFDFVLSSEDMSTIDGLDSHTHTCWVPDHVP